ncbi:MAG: hypothetical protein ABIT76_03615 [Chthoniobacterales bacterium]
MKRIHESLLTSRVAIESVFYEALYHALSKSEPLQAKRPGEVKTLINFFLQLPTMQETLNAVLSRHHISAELKGVFCHKAGASGPVVDFDIPTTGPGCELCDLLVLVTYEGDDGELALGNACFLQAKVERSDLSSGVSTMRQRKLYEEAPTFRFRNSGNYSLPNFSDSTSGHRTMPGAKSKGFCYWAFMDGHPMPNWMLNTSTVTEPLNVDAPKKDLSFGGAMFDLMTGQFGIKVDPVSSTEFAWNRIVHDVVLRAMSEALRCSSGIIAVKDVPRIAREGRALLREALHAELALVSNPFVSLADAFNSPQLKESAASYVKEKNKISKERLEKILLHEDDEGGEPPDEKQREFPADGNGGGSFIHINLKVAEGPTRTVPNGRKITL